MPNGITPKIKDFRTFLEMHSASLACEQTDSAESIIIGVVNPQSEFTVMPNGITPKIRDFRTFLEMHTIVLLNN